MRYAEPRAVRRLAKRRDAAAKEAERLAAVEQRRSEREEALRRFGPAADERRTDRRQPGSPQDLAARMRAAGITQDRRKGDRRR